MKREAKTSTHHHNRKDYTEDHYFEGSFSSLGMINKKNKIEKITFHCLYVKWREGKTGCGWKMYCHLHLQSFHLPENDDILGQKRNFSWDFTADDFTSSMLLYQLLANHFNGKIYPNLFKLPHFRKTLNGNGLLNRKYKWSNIEYASLFQ